MTVKLVDKEIADLAKEDLGEIQLAPDESSIFKWKAILPGPAGSPYEGGRFQVDITVPPEYPFSPPHLTFRTKVYHCNINSSEGICFELLKHNWSPALSLYKVILSLSSLLTDPNPADPLVPPIANKYKRNRAKHDAMARDWTALYAKPHAVQPAEPAQAATQEADPGPVPRPARQRRGESADTRLGRADAGGSGSGVAQLAGTRRSRTANDSRPSVNAVRPARAGDTGRSSARKAIRFEDDSDQDVADSSDVEILIGAPPRLESDRRVNGRANKRAGSERQGDAAPPAADEVIVIDD